MLWGPARPLRRVAGAAAPSLPKQSSGCEGLSHVCIGSVSCWASASEEGGLKQCPCASVPVKRPGEGSNAHCPRPDGTIANSDPISSGPSLRQPGGAQQPFGLSSREGAAGLHRASRELRRSMGS
ncbi:hypothetical protein ABPG75_003703 [Micractinium tetrahymenae]